MKEFFTGIVIIAILGAGSYFFVARGKKASGVSVTQATNEVSQQASSQSSSQPTSSTAKTSSVATKTTPVSTPVSPTRGSSAVTPSVAPVTLQVTTLQAGEGAGAKSGDTLEVHYTGNLWNGAVFDSSYTRGEPFEFTLGQGEVILGWDEGMIGMKKGEARKLVIPPDYGYGSYGTPGGPIPPNATLVFTVELISINGK